MTRRLAQDEDDVRPTLVTDHPAAHALPDVKQTPLPRPIVAGIVTG
jgi:hypothetical protein